MPVNRIDADPFFIPKPDSTRHYRWISDDPKRLALWLRSIGDSPGYKLERGDTVKATQALAEKLGFSPDYVDRGKNCIRFGFNLLASIPVEERDKRVEYLQRMQTEQLDAAQDQFLSDADRMRGVKGFIKDPAEVQDQKKHALREDRPFSGQTGT